MTRETKIGLLVGLAFIIVIGILLSDHLTSSNEPPPAVLANAGNNIRAAVNTPGAGTSTLSATVATPPTVLPRSIVPTPTDIAPRPQPVQPIQVAVGGPTPQNNVAQPVETHDAPPADPVRAPQQDNTLGNNNTDAIITKAPPVSPEDPHVAPHADNGGDIASALRNAAAQHNEELVAFGGKPNGVAGTPRTDIAIKQYVAVEGDSISKMAGRFLGGSNRANRDAIIAVNPALKQDPNKVIAGRIYNIPTSAAVASTPINGAAVIPASSTHAPSDAHTSADNWYTVKEGDSLWKISTEQCGSASAIPAIKELNKEILKGDTVVINTKLRLPNKVATAN